MTDSIDSMARKYLNHMHEGVGMREFIASRRWLCLSEDMEKFLLENEYMTYTTSSYLPEGDVKVTFTAKAAEVAHSMGFYLPYWPEYCKK